MKLVAPAKINLGLRIVGRRPDGYHELESLFLPLDLADEISLSVRDAPAPSVTLELEGESPGVPAGADNLAARAARSFLEAAGLCRHVHLVLAKRIPAGAGLGGGSSDAGAVLRGLAEALPGSLPDAELATLALRLGADVPFFLSPRPAWVTGTGERVEDLADVPSLCLLLAHPGSPLATAEVYRAYDALHLEGPPPRAGGRPPLPGVDFARSRDPDFLRSLAPWLANDLEGACVRLCPAAARLRRRLEAAGALAVGLSGSGPTFFAVFSDRAAATAALDRGRFEPPDWARVAATNAAR